MARLSGCSLVFFLLCGGNGIRGDYVRLARQDREVPNSRSQLLIEGNAGLHFRALVTLMMMAQPMESFNVGMGHHLGLGKRAGSRATMVAETGDEKHMVAPMPSRRTLLTTGLAAATAAGAVPRSSNALELSDAEKKGAAAADLFGRPLGKRSKPLIPESYTMTKAELIRSKNALKTIQKSFPKADFMDAWANNCARALEAPSLGIKYGNAIPIVGLCRDESNAALRNQIEAIYGPSFTASGLGGLWNMGVSGMKAAIGHAPVVGGKPRYVFVAMPHIAINENGDVGEISRAGKCCSEACGALFGSLNALKKTEDWETLITPKAKTVATQTTKETDLVTLAQAVETVAATLGADAPEAKALRERLAEERKKFIDARAAQAETDDEEIGLLLSKLAKELKEQGIDRNSLNLVTVTKVAETIVAEELYKLIEATVDPTKADYAVLTGIQVHCSADEVTARNPTLEFIVPGRSFAMVNEEKVQLALPDPSASLARLEDIVELRDRSGPDSDLSKLSAARVLLDGARNLLGSED